MFRVRGKTDKGKSVSGTSAAETYAEAAEEAESAAEASGGSLVQLSIKPLESDAGISVAEPRKREGAKKGGKK